MLQLEENLKVEEAMSSKYLSFQKNVILKDVVEGMLEANAKEAFVEEAGKLVGMLSLTDVAMIKSKKLNEYVAVEYYMVKHLIVVEGDKSIKECRDIMIRNDIGRIPVVRGSELIGVIREAELRNSFYMKMEENGRNLNHALENIHEAVCVADHNGFVLIWNKSAEKLYGIDKEEILGKKLEEHFPNALILRVLKSKKAINNLYHAPREGHSVVLSAEPIVVNGEMIGAVSTDRDVTEITELTNELEAANKAVKILKREVKKLSFDNLGQIIGKSAVLKKKVDVARQVAKTEATILIKGESGTGKEVFARGIHGASERKGMFVPVNCGAIPPGLFESELFGYVEGAFTGARKSGKMGMFEMAQNGTVFLDEIGEMPLQMQAKLLRVLQEREVMRVGGEKSIAVNARVISATNRKLKEMVKEGKFREDLYYRLDVVEIELPTLRERKGDIPLLINAFLKEFCQKANRPVPKVDRDVMEILENYKWEGNIRQLKNTVEYLLVMSMENHISADIVPSYILNDVDVSIATKPKEYPLDLNEAVKFVEMENIKKALEMCDGNKAQASKVLNVPRTTLIYKMKHYGFIK